MPVTTPKHDRILVELFLSAYEKNSWAGSQRIFPEEQRDGAVDIVATRSDGMTLAIEHTLIEPFIGDTWDFLHFQRSFLPLEGDESLPLAGHTIYLHVPVLPLDKAEREAASDALRQWLRLNLTSLPIGLSEHDCSFSTRTKQVSLAVKVSVVPTPKHEGRVLIRRYGEAKIADTVKKALTRKLRKLASESVDRRILLLERNQLWLSELDVLDDIEKQKSSFSVLEAVDEIWLADTTFGTEVFVGFRRYENRELMQAIEFHAGRLCGRFERE